MSYPILTLCLHRTSERQKCVTTWENTSSCVFIVNYYLLCYFIIQITWKNICSTSDYRWYPTNGFNRDLGKLDVSCAFTASYFYQLVSFCLKLAKLPSAYSQAVSAMDLTATDHWWGTSWNLAKTACYFLDLAIRVFFYIKANTTMYAPKKLLPLSPYL